MPNIPVYELKATEDLNRHGMYVLGAIKKIVNKIDDTEYLEKLFDDLSDKHRRIGVEASGMDVFGKVFCKVMRPILLGNSLSQSYKEVILTKEQFVLKLLVKLTLMIKKIFRKEKVEA